MRYESLLAGLVYCLLTLPLQATILSSITPAPSSAKEGVEFDSDTGNYIITYEAADELRPQGLYQTVYIPATKINPAVKSRFKEEERTGAITYGYKVKNGKDSKQNLQILIVIVSNVYAGLESPRHWDGLLAPEVPLGAGFRVAWSYAGGEGLGGVTPGASLGGLGFKSGDLPGVGIMQLMGATPILAFVGYGPSQEIEDKIKKISKKDYVPRPIALPKIPVPSPFDAAAVLTSLRKHVKEDIVSMKLIEQDFAAKLDQGFGDAVEAASRGNTEGLRHELKALRHMLKGYGEPEEADHAAKKREDDDGHEDRIKTRDWPHPIAKLAARVLDFDLKYIEKRLKGSRN